MNKPLLLAALGIKPIRDQHITTKAAVFYAALVVLSQIGDGVSTYFGLTHGGANEGNPLMAAALHAQGWAGFATAKLLGTLVLLWLTWRRKWGSLVVVGVYALIVAWNTYLTLKGL